ncbi:MAG: hypothetical protein GX625_06370 [Clostridiaceae bacterium]|nr:hypothetical protein [Clostridiaceae bacterium]
MTCKIPANNPFKVTSPEQLGVEDMKTLFVDDLNELEIMKDEGHMMLKGPRGVGKSMIFRYLQADCQCKIDGEKSFTDLDFVGLHLPIRNESFVKITELRRLGDDFAADLFMEHLMVITFALRGFCSISKIPTALDCISPDSFRLYYNEKILPYFNSGDQKEITLTDNRMIMATIINRLQSEYNKAIQYMKRLSFCVNARNEYDGLFLDYQDFLLPILGGLREISGFPNAPIYLLIDDAHFLTEAQTRILNSWIATRYSNSVSIKISTQYDYKTFYTVTGATIDTPHDYKQIDLWELYTNKDSYRTRIRNIISRRLEYYGIEGILPEAFFPPDEEQEAQISKIYEEYKERAQRGEGRGYSVTDDAYRYARADFIKGLYGKRKSAHTYSYSGFEQLVNISSGVVRYFLDAAHDMYAEQLEKNDKMPVTLILPGIQNGVVRKLAIKFLKDELDDYKIEGHDRAAPKEDFNRLTNLINGLGTLFNAILLSERSERRVFSIAISDEMTDLTERIFNLGVRYGYFHKSTIGRKERGSGRTRRFVMNRRLAPIWNLDPNSFAGYLFMKNELLEEAMSVPEKILRRIKVLDSSANSEASENVQLTLFDIYDSDVEKAISISVEDFYDKEAF